MVLKANDRRTSSPCHDEFCGPRSDYVRQVALATTTTTNRVGRHYDVPPLERTSLEVPALDNWQKITKIIQLILKRWSADYLNSLQQRNKWHFEKKNAKIGDMVIIKEDNVPSCQWSLGRINNIYPGKDSKVRVVEVETTREHVRDVYYGENPKSETGAD
ncbi:integrase catalytic domain-containing protein [Trichonephila clavipes]|uniref:Integrase catalytic domain-containing protein n=1 Tax=Trichonephila clavipes TaxID=2585209 RepID=A0A8X6W4S1_TRICX|nr:integrase catalytic domain-containing protein [Trichonephila clavipes]